MEDKKRVTAVLEEGASFTTDENATDWVYKGTRVGGFEEQSDGGGTILELPADKAPIELLVESATAVSKLQQDRDSRSNLLDQAHDLIRNAIRLLEEQAKVDASKPDTV